MVDDRGDGRGVSDRGVKHPPVQEVLLHGENGILVDFFDVQGWSDALIKALADPKAGDAMRVAARRTALAEYDLRGVCLPRMVAFVESFAPA